MFLSSVCSSLLSVAGLLLRTSKSKQLSHDKASSDVYSILVFISHSNKKIYSLWKERRVLWANKIQVILLSVTSLLYIQRRIRTYWPSGGDRPRGESRSGSGSHALRWQRPLSCIHPQQSCLHTLRARKKIQWNSVVKKNTIYRVKHKPNYYVICTPKAQGWILGMGNQRFYIVNINGSTYSDKYSTFTRYLLALTIKVSYSGNQKGDVRMIGTSVGRLTIKRSNHEYTTLLTLTCEPALVSILA